MQGANDKLYWIEGLSNRHTVKCNKKKGCVKTLFTTMILINFVLNILQTFW